LISASESWTGTSRSDPPCYCTQISLKWRTRTEPAVTGAVTRTLRSSTVLTLGDVFDGAVDEEISVYLYGSVGKSLRDSARKDCSLQEIVPRLEQETGKAAVIVAEASWITTYDVVIPSLGVLTRMRANGDSRIKAGSEGEGGREERRD